MIERYVSRAYDKNSNFFCGVLVRFQSKSPLWPAAPMPSKRSASSPRLFTSRCGCPAAGPAPSASATTARRQSPSLYYTPGRDGTRNAARRPGSGGRPRGCGFEVQGGGHVRVYRGGLSVYRGGSIPYSLSVCMCVRRILYCTFYIEGI